MAEKTNGAPPAAPQTVPSKKEAVRLALEEMGRNATASQLRPRIRERFGIDMSLKHISTAKNKILHGESGRRAAATPAAAGAAASAAPEAAPAEGERTSAPPRGGKGKAGLSIKEAVRRAMEIAGPDAASADLRAVIRKRFRLDLTGDQVNNARSDMRRGAGAAPQPAAAPAAAAPPPQAGDFLLADIRATRDLLARLGAERLKGLVDVLAR